VCRMHKASLGKVEVSGLPPHVNWPDLQGALSTAGNILHSELTEGGEVFIRYNYFYFSF
jgi:hypothetical protein